MRRLRLDFRTEKPLLRINTLNKVALSLSRSAILSSVYTNSSSEICLDERVLCSVHSCEGPSSTQSFRSERQKEERREADERAREAAERAKEAAENEM